MQQRLSDYIADFLAAHGLQDVFTVTGGGAMYMNDSFGHHAKLRCTYYHHEQAAAMAAEAYARIDNRMAAVCVTTGPGATNAITGVVCGWMDSIPMLVFSGQARWETTVYASGLKLRTRGIQEFDITGSVRNMTKYCEIVSDPQKIRYCLEKACYLAQSGRPGPCWLDIPLDVQGAMISPEELTGYTPPEAAPEAPSLKTVQAVVARLRQAQRPLLYAGNGIRLSGKGVHEQFLRLVDLLNIPVVTGSGSVDAIASGHRLFVGRMGTSGDRAANFAVQNCDVFLSIGSRLSFAQTGFNHEQWAQNAYKILNDIDPEELEKDSLHADLKICCDAGQLIRALLEACAEGLAERPGWLGWCQRWKEKYPVALPKHYADPQPNIYAFFHEMTSRLTAEDRLVISVGTSRVAGSQAACITEGMRLITNPSTAAMGYCLPAAIGVCIASGKRKTILVTGEGSLQMNLQELQTIVQNRLPIAIFVMNNQGYHSIRMTQKSFFEGKLVGVGEESGDLSFPDLERIAYAYQIPFQRCRESGGMIEAIEWALGYPSTCLCEMMLSKEQMTEPKVASRRLENGTMISGTFENMAPFLPQQEVEENMLPLRCLRDQDLQEQLLRADSDDTETINGLKNSGGGGISFNGIPAFKFRPCAEFAA